MARPKHCRRVGSMPASNYFKPKGVPLSVLEEVVLAMDEFEAIRLADLEGLYQEQAAERMKVSRQTFGRIVESAHKKIAEALVKENLMKVGLAVQDNEGVESKVYDHFGSAPVFIIIDIEGKAADKTDNTTCSSLRLESSTNRKRRVSMRGLLASS